MTLDSWLYGNPESVLQAKQERQLKRKQSCAGCINLRSIEFNGDVVIACALKRTAIVRRCEFYKK